MENKSGMEIQRTPLYQKHIDAHAKIIDFAGWALPVEYTSVLKEAQAVRKYCGLFDATHMGEIRLSTAAKATALLERLVTNDISSLKVGAMQYNLFLNAQAGVIDDCMIYRENDSYLCVVNAVNKDKVLAWIKAHAGPGVDIADESQNLALLSIQGPAAESIVAKAVDKSLTALDYMRFRRLTVDSRELLISRSGYTAEDGFELYVPWQHACYWWDRLFACSRGFELIACGLGARDILRIEAGYPLYGHELSESIDPYSASLAWAVKCGSQSIAYQALNRIRLNQVSQRRIGFIMQQRALPRQGYRVLSAGTEIGQVTSGTYSPNIGQFIGMAYVQNKYASVGGEIAIEIRNKTYKARVAKLPFVVSRVKTSRRNMLPQASGWVMQKDKDTTGGSL